MKKVFIPLIVVLGIYACTQATKPTEEAQQGIYNAFCYNGDSASSLCSVLPPEVAITLGFDYHTDSTPTPVFQPPFDVFSWQTFIALNWPADNMGNPIGSSITDNPNAMRVWEYYKDPLLAFNNNPVLLLQLKSATNSNVKFLYQDSKIPTDFKTKDDGSFTEADGQPLADRNGNFTLFEIKINNVEDTFITTNKLNTNAGIYKYVLDHNSLAEGLELPISDTSGGMINDGTMEIKASWRIMNPAKGDDTTQFYCRKALIFVDSAHTANHKPMQVWATVGLVGMHIIRNISGFDQFLIWSTFEHVNNAPDLGKESQGGPWSFYNSQSSNPVNTPPPHVPSDGGNFRWNPTQPFAGLYYPQFGTQVVREKPIFDVTEQVNKKWQAKLTNTVWANYKLVGTQWQINTRGEVETPAPAYLANTTMETYMQGTASCIGCHNNASVQFVPKPGDTVNIKTDLSFLFPFNAR
jgi:hypothetical protein